MTALRVARAPAEKKDAIRGGSYWTKFKEGNMSMTSGYGYRGVNSNSQKTGVRACVKRSNKQ